MAKTKVSKEKSTCISDLSKVRKHRAHTPSKTGCITSKKRPIKCDEEEPSCQKGTKSKRICGHSSKPWQISKNRNLVPRSPSALRTIPLSCKQSPTPSLSFQNKLLPTVSTSQRPIPDPDYDSGYSDNDGDGGYDTIPTPPGQPVVDEIYKMIKELLRGRLHLAPLQAGIQNIICIGEGFGDWANDIGDKFPSAIVEAVDRWPMEFCSQNVAFYADDIEEPWPQKDNLTDFVHAGLRMQSLRNPSHFFKEAFRILKPGTWIEIADFQSVQYKDGAVLKNDYFVYFEELRYAQQKLGRDVDAILKVPAELEHAGFIDIRYQVSEMPIGDWPAKTSLRKIGLKFKDQAKADVRETRGRIIKHLTQETLTVLCSRAEQCLEDLEGTYFPLHTLIAQKPLIQ